MPALLSTASINAVPSTVVKIKPLLQSLASTAMRAPRSAQIGAGAVVVATLLAIATALSSTSSSLPDMRSIDNANTRKATFFGYLRPIVESLNAEILAQRASLRKIADDFRNDKKLSLLNGYQLKSLAQEYEVEWNESDPAGVLAELRRRIDIVPIPLVLVQAAKESGWGTSRFARSGNNLFGQWCYSPGCGIVPARRSSGTKHEVRVFDSVEDAVSAYLHNLNTSSAYRALRQIRARLRDAGKKPDGTSLADGLLFYSQRREAYVNEVKLMLHQYQKFERRQQG